MHEYAEVAEKSGSLGTVEAVCRKVRARVRGDEVVVRYRQGGRRVLRGGSLSQFQGRLGG